MRSAVLLLLATTMLSACSLSPDFTPPDAPSIDAYKEQDTEIKGRWAKAAPLENTDRGQWWKIFGDEQLNTLEQLANDNNPSLQAAAARVEESRQLAKSERFSWLPDIGVGANATRAKSSDASLVAFGAPPGSKARPYTLYSTQGVASYEADLFGRVRDNYKALRRDTDAEAANYKSAMLALQADVAQRYFTIRALDSERQLLHDSVTIYEEGARIMQRRFELGDVGEQDHARADSLLAAGRAELLQIERQRNEQDHALAVLLGKLPAEYSFPETPLSADSAPPHIPAGLPSTLLARRPDVSGALAAMEAANARIGVARTAFFPQIFLTASGGFESLELPELLRWSSRSWALGQAGAAITMPIFDSGRNIARVSQAQAAYQEALHNYQQQVLVAFRDVEDNLSEQRLLAEQAEQQNIAAERAVKTTELSRKRYVAGETDFFELVESERTSLVLQQTAVQMHGQRFVAAVTLIRALGGDFGDMTPVETAPAQPSPLNLTAEPQTTPAPADNSDAITLQPAQTPEPSNSPVEADPLLRPPAESPEAPKN